jgi:hypothetical protein
MPHLKFTEPELFLLEKWDDVYKVQRGANQTRERYAEVFLEVLDRVKSRHKELNRRAFNDIGTMATDESLGYINVGIGRAEWPSREPRRWPTGFWIGGVTLEDLYSQSGSKPYASVWLYPPKSASLNLKIAAHRIQKEAGRLRGKARSGTVSVENTWASVDLYLPERPEQLRTLLVKDVTGFIECMVAHFEGLAELTNAIDAVFEFGKPKSERRQP